MENLFDTHFHLDLQKDRAAAIRHIEEQRIYTIAVTNLPDLYRKEKTEVASKYIRYALGFHPELVHQFPSQIPLMWELLPEARYIGEVGLDFVDASFRKEQEAFFYELVERCRYDRSKIITIHSRKAVKQVLDIVGTNFRFKPILHWFSGSKDELIKAIEASFYISVNSAMVKSIKFQDLLSLIPSERLLLETDSPFTNLRCSHSETLKYVKDFLERQKDSISLWENFKRVLE